MPDEPRRIVLEKSRTVRRRHQRSNKRFEFTASQIARIEREEERERRAKKLREKEKKRIENKKKKAEKEAQAREERKRNGGPDPDAFAVPSSQPLLSKFLQRPQKPQPIVVDNVETGESTEEPDSAGDVETEPEEGDPTPDPDPIEASDHTAATTKDKDITEYNETGAGDDDDEFSDCSFDEDIFREAETVATAQQTKPTDCQDTPKQGELKPPDTTVEKPAFEPSLGESFQDDTAALLEEFGNEFDTDEEFEQELLQLDPV